MPIFWSKFKKPILALAPMAGYTDSAFRILCLENGADVVYTEMISAEGLARQNKKTLKMLEFLPGEKNVIVQLFGTNPEAFGKATEIIGKRSHRSAVSGPRDDINPIVGIDVNFGCPAKKVFHTGAGAALMNNKKMAREIVEAVLKNTKLPVSIKIRSQVKNTTAEEFIEYLKDLPIAMVMVHGRTLAQGFSGEINYEAIKNIKKLLPKVIVLGNGGINSVEDARIMLEKTGCDGVGIARGALGQPWIFGDIKKYYNHPGPILHRTTPPLKGGDATVAILPFRRGGAPTAVGAEGLKIWPEIKSTMLAHAKLFLKQNENLIPLRKHLVHYVKGLPNASELRQKLIQVETLAELEKILKK
ncbi:MAG: tRNA-dihydrouridine synthase [Patescibacteria group bacterium]|nr:tRNA-dihydrouridine synthase [Patescibacteria group bacterium]